MVKRGWRQWWVGAVVLVSLAGATASVEAQTVAGADALSAQAVTLYDQMTRYREAAELHVRAAQSRPSDDARRVEDLRMAGRLYTYAGDLAEGRRWTEMAARAALTRGDLAEAGHIYVDAAILALREGDREGGRRLLKEARWIAGAPTLAGQDGRMLRRRLAE